MPRRSREDFEGSWHHVTNRGLAQRSVFESRQDVRYFLSRLAYAVRSGRIEIHAFSILVNHFHLLVKSPRGEMSRALCRVLNEYVRWFNRRRWRDGPLFRGRYWSRRIESDTYFWTVIRYIDQNAVEARLVHREESYPFCSAFHYARPMGPRWLRRDVIERIAMESAGFREYTPRAYRETLGRVVTPHEVHLVDRRLRAGRNVPDPLDDLVRASPAAVRRWLRAMAEKADGARMPLPVTTLSALSATGDSMRISGGCWRIRPGRTQRDGWPILLSGLLRQVAGMSFEEISAVTGRSKSTALADYRLHLLLMAGDDEYAATASAVTAGALKRTHGEVPANSEQIVTPP